MIIKFPASLYKLIYINNKGKEKKVIFKTLYINKNLPKQIILSSINLQRKIKDIDKLCSIVYIRNEKNWKYHNKTFHHDFNGFEKIYLDKKNKNKIIIESLHRLWGYKKVSKSDL